MISTSAGAILVPPGKSELLSISIAEAIGGLIDPGARQRSSALLPTMRGLRRSAIKSSMSAVLMSVSAQSLNRSSIGRMRQSDGVRQREFLHDGMPLFVDVGELAERHRADFTRRLSARVERALTNRGPHLVEHALPPSSGCRDWPTSAGSHGSCPTRRARSGPACGPYTRKFCTVPWTALSRVPFTSRAPESRRLPSILGRPGVRSVPGIQ
jgi:hypothetical protein